MKTENVSYVRELTKLIRAAVLLYTLFMCLMSSDKIYNTNHLTDSRMISISSVYADGKSGSKGGGDNGGNTSGESSGVSELDSAKKRTNGIVVWFCHWIGGVVAIISFIVFLFMAGSHQTEQRNTALVVMLMGIAVYFAPSIVNYVLGKTIF